MICIERILGMMTVAKSIVNMMELAIGTVNVAREWSIDENTPGTYPIKNNINGHPAQKR